MPIYSMTEKRKRGTTATLQLPMRSGGPLFIKVELLDERTNFGRTDWLVSPIGGEGEAWVSEDALS